MKKVKLSKKKFDALMGDAALLSKSFEFWEQRVSKVLSEIDYLDANPGIQNWDRRFEAAQKEMETLLLRGDMEFEMQGAFLDKLDKLKK